MKISTEQRIKDFDDHMKIENYAYSTRRNYTLGLGQFLAWKLSERIEEGISQDQAKAFILYRYEKGAKWQTINTIYSSLRKYFESVLDIPWSIKKLPRPRTEHTIPVLLSQSEVKRIIDHATLYKHQVIMTLLYATGIRLGELVQIKIEDIHSGTKKIFIRKGKGSKDRYVDLHAKLLEVLRSYYKRYKPEGYLFNGNSKGSKMSSTAVQKAIKVAKRRAKIHKQVSTHTFRHCFATHHLELGTNIVYLQSQMGHKQLKTTARYIHLTEEYPNTICHPISKMKIIYHKKNRPLARYLGTGQKYI